MCVCLYDSKKIRYKSHLVHKLHHKRPYPHIDFWRIPADSSTESAYSSANIMKFGQQSVLNVFNVYLSIQLAGRNWLTFAIDYLKSGYGPEVSMSLYLEYLKK